MATCSACKKEINASARICPYCKTEQVGFFEAFANLNNSIDKLFKGTMEWSDDSVLFMLDYLKSDEKSDNEKLSRLIKWLDENDMIADPKQWLKYLGKWEKRFGKKLVEQVIGELQSRFAKIVELIDSKYGSDKNILARQNLINNIKGVANTPYDKLKSNCYIATVAYDSPFSWQVVLFRNYRDRVLLETFIGRMAVTVYYMIGPFFAFLASKSKIVNNSFRKILDIILKYYLTKRI